MESHEHQQKSETREAQVICKMNHKKWVPWELRHEGNDPTKEKFAAVRCQRCTGEGRTTYTGIMRG